MDNRMVGFNRDEFIAKAQNLFEAAGNAPMKTYKSLNGAEYAEYPGAYNDRMVRAMCHDMTQAWISLRNTPLEDRIQGWMPKMTVLNTEINRMMDDLNGDRPVKAQKLKKWNKLRAEIEDVIGAPEVQESYITDLADRMKAWDENLAYQLSWIYYLRETYQMNYIDPQLGWTETGSDKSPTTGLTPAEEGQIKNINEVRRIMLDTYLRIPVNTPEHRECREKLDALARTVDNIMDRAADAVLEDDGPETEEMKAVKETVKAGEKELSDVLTAIKVVTDKIQNKLDGNKAQDIPLKDKVTAGRVLLSRFGEKLDGKEDVPAEMFKGIVEVLRGLADDIELAQILS